MATKTIPQLTALGAAPATDDLLEIADTSAASASKSITVANLFTSPTLSGTVGGTYTFGGTPTWPATIAVATSISPGNATLAQTRLTLSNGTQGARWTSNTTNGNILLDDLTASGAASLQLGGSTSSFPMLKRSTTTVTFRLADDSADAGITAAGGTFSGNVSTTGSLSTGVGGSTAGNLALTQGTAPSTGTTNVTLTAPASVTSYIVTMPSAVGSTGIVAWTVSGSTATLSSTATTGSGNVVLATSPTLTTPLLGTPTSGTLTNCTGYTVANLSGGGTGVVTQLGLAADGSDVDAIGFRGIPQQSKSAAYTTVMADAGKCIFHPSSDANARTFTIDSNANVAYEVGTVIKFKNMSASNVTIAITSDTMTLLPAGTTGSRTLAQYGEAYAEKISSTAWTISGNSALT